MATARELIEQADALMRRNRSQAERPAEVIHASPMPRVGSLAGVDDVPLPLAPAREALSAVPKAPAGEVPLLTDAVDASPAAAEAPGDDVPVLTDAIEEIEAPPLVEAEDEGEVSEWRIDEEDDSVFARIPPSVLAAVPPLRAEVPLAERAPPAVARPIEAQPAPPAAEAREPDDVDRALGLDHPPAGTAAVQAADPDAAAQPAVEDARWAAMAEEIRIQILQRIDIFTDTGLRERLGERLKPVVDRASADLVATINQHVGDLLRAYVAEAIEREIEKWKNESGPR